MRRERWKGRGRERKGDRGKQVREIQVGADWLPEHLAEHTN